MANSKTVANRFLELASEHRDSLTPMQLLKLVYLAHGWMLGTYKRPLIDDRIEAWMYGPVIPDLYEALRHYRKSPVRQTLQAPTETLTPEMREVINRVYQTYRGWDGFQLSALTHLQGTPWEETYHNKGDWQEIPNFLIEDYYSKKIAKAQHASE